MVTHGRGTGGSEQPQTPEFRTGGPDAPGRPQTSALEPREA